MATTEVETIPQGFEIVSEQNTETIPEGFSVVESKKPEESARKKLLRTVGDSVTREFLTPSRISVNSFDIPGKSASLAHDIYSVAKEELMRSSKINSALEKIPNKPLLSKEIVPQQVLTGAMPGLDIAQRILASVPQRELAKQGVSAGLDVVAGAVSDGILNAGSIATRLSPKLAEKSVNQAKESVINAFRKAVPVKLPKNANYNDIKKTNSNIFEGINILFQRKDKVMNFVNADGVVENRLPESLLETSQAVKSAKDAIYKEYSELSGSSQSSISGDEISDYLREALKDPVLQVPQFDDVRTYLEGLIKGYKQKQFTFETTEKLISELVKNSMSKIRETGVQRKVAEIDGNLASFLINKIDDSVSTFPKEYSGLRSQYKVLRQLETDITRAANRNLSAKDRASFGDYLNMFALSDMALGAAEFVSGKPGGLGRIVKGAVGEGVLKSVSLKRDPNRSINLAFRKFEDAQKRAVIKTGSEQVYDLVKKFLAGKV